MSSEQIPPSHLGCTDHGWERWQRRLITFYVAFGHAIAALAFIALAGPIHRIFKPYPDFPTLEAQGNILIATLDRYHAKHGNYPPTLKDAGVANSETRWGDWSYTPNGNGFELSLGDYDWDGFVLTWDRKGGWFLNH